MRKNEERVKKKICLVSSCGGHLTEIRQLMDIYCSYDHYYVLNDRIELPKDMIGRTYFIRHSERDWLFLVNLCEAIKIMLKEKPTAIISTGAGPVIPFAVIARLFFKTRIIFIETITRIYTPSLTGMIMYRIAHRFYYQWKSLESSFPRGTYCGRIM